MTEFKMEPDRDCINEYVKIAVTGKTANKALMAALYVSTGMIAVMGIVMTVMLSQPIMLIITGVGILAGAAYPILIHSFTKGAVDKTVNSMEKNSGLVMAVSEMNIIVIKDGIPTGIIEWESITGVTEGRTGFFLRTKDGTLLLLPKSMVSSGTYEEAAQVLRGRADKIKAEASGKDGK